MKIHEKIVNTLKSKWLKNTEKTILLVVIIVAIFIAINLIMEKIDLNDIDLTEGKYYSLTDESVNAIGKIPDTDNIEIYIFDYAEDDPVVDFIKKYSKIKDNIKVEVVSVDSRPDLANKYNIESGYYTVLIRNSDKFKLLTSSDFSDYNYSTGENIDITEQRLTNGIIGISSIGKTIPVYVLNSNNKYDMLSDMYHFVADLALENYEVKELNLLTEGKVPEDCTNLIITSPTKDFTEIEAKAIKEYINNGGNILWFSDIYSLKEEAPNINSILDLYGVKVRQDGYVAETDASKVVSGYPDLIIPTVEYSELTDGISQVLLIDSGRLQFAENLEELKVTKTDLLTSSEKAFFRTDLSRALNISKQDDEEEGTQVLAAMLEKTIGEGENTKTSKLVVFANNLFMTSNGIKLDEQTYPAIWFLDNGKLVLNSVQHISNVEDSLVIRKPIKSTYYTPTKEQDILIQVIIFSMPVIIMIFGIVVWRIRRRKK